MVDFRGPAGERMRMSTGERDKSKAELKAAELMTKAHRRASSRELKSVPPRPGRMSFGQLLGYVERRHWEQQRGYRTMKSLVADLIAKVGHHAIEDVTYAVLSVYCDERATEGDTNATLNRRMSVASKALREAEKMGWIQAGPRVPRFREAAIRERYLEEGEEARLMEKIRSHCSPDRPEWVYMAALVPFLLDTGLRLGEALALTQANYKPSTGAAAMIVASEGGTEGLVERMAEVIAKVPEGKRQSAAVILRHGTTKSQKGRHVPLTPRAEASLLAMLSNSVHGSIRGDGVYQRFIRACGEAGITGVKVHTLRHTCASRLVQRGVPLLTVSKWLGHSSYAVTMRYAHLAAEDLDSAMQALAG